MSFQEKFAEKLIELGERLKGEVKLEAEPENEPVETKLMEAKTIDGNIIVSPDETLQENSEVFIRTEDGDLPLPTGEYTLEDGTIIVADNGLVASISAPSAEPEQEDEMAAEPQAKKITETIKQEVEFATKELAAQLSAVKAEFEKFVENTNKNFEGVADFSEKVTNLLEQPVTKGQKEKQELSEVKPMTTAERVKKIRENLKYKSI